jgi:hypothetical protein
MRRTILLAGRGNERAEVLMVPWVPQHTASTLCFPASLQMVLQFYADHHDRRRELDGVPRPSLDDVVSSCHTSIENGTRISTELIERLNATYSKLSFELKSGFTVDGVRKLLGKGVPPILIYDGQYLLTEVAGPGHAGVCVGSARNGDIILNNPWLGQGYAADKGRFEQAWDIRGRRAVIVRIKSQKTLRVEEPNADSAAADH